MWYDVQLRQQTEILHRHIKNKNRRVERKWSFYGGDDETKKEKSSDSYVDQHEVSYNQSLQDLQSQSLTQSEPKSAIYAEGCYFSDLMQFFVTQSKSPRVLDVKLQKLAQMGFINPWKYKRQPLSSNNYNNGEGTCKTISMKVDVIYTPWKTGGSQMKIPNENTFLK